MERDGEVDRSLRDRRLAPGQSVDQARASDDVVTPGLRAAGPGWQASVTRPGTGRSWQDEWDGGDGALKSNTTIRREQAGIDCQ
mgnify:CR=1 FL=1